MSWLLFGSVCLIAISLALEALQRSLADAIKHALYRTRDRVFDRVLAGELAKDDPAVRDIVATIHSMIYVITHWPVPEIVRALREPQTPAKLPKWITDERLKDEAQRALILSGLGMLVVSGMFKIRFLRVLARFASESSLQVLKDFAIRMAEIYSSPAVSDSERLSVMNG